MNQATEMYNQLMVDNPSLASKVDVRDIKKIIKLNKPRLRKWIRKIWKDGLLE